MIKVINKCISCPRLWAVLCKEFIQMRRDRLTFAMIIGIPIMQLILFGYAINTSPKNLPTAVVAADSSTFVRSFIAGLKNSDYYNSMFKVLSVIAELPRALARGARARTAPLLGFSPSVLKGLKPQREGARSLWIHELKHMAIQKT